MRTRVGIGSAVLATVLSLTSVPARAAEESAWDPPTGEDSVVELESGGRLSIFPKGDLVMPYIADPHAPDSSISAVYVPSVGVERTGKRRPWLRLGGRFGLLRWRPAGEDGRSWQLSLDAGIDAMFDEEEKLDNIGWDGNYGLSITTSRGGRWGYRLAFLHTSAHVGDEYAERNGRRRIGYTRGEWLLAATRLFRTEWRWYGEAGYSFNPKPQAFQDHLRLQTGLEWQRSGRQRGKRFGRYLATDVSAMQELDWRLDIALQGGIMIESGGRTWRLGLELYDGRVPLGEFYQDRESYMTLGLWTDL